MKKVATPILLCAFGLFVAHYYFGVDIEGLTKGFIDFMTGILKGSG